MVFSRFVDRDGLISEQSYFSKDADKLKNIPCPTCGDKGGLFVGIWCIQCRNCQNLFFTQEEFREYLIVIN